MRYARSTASASQLRLRGPQHVWRWITNIPLLGRTARFLRSYVNGNPWQIVATYVLNCLRYRAVASPWKVVHVDPADIVWRVSVPTDQFESWRHGRVHGGDWDVVDLRRTHDLEKVRSMRQRFVEGHRWEDTELFQHRYRDMLARGQTVKGQRSIGALADHYEAVYDVLWSDLARRGVVGPTWRDPRPTFIEVHVGRDGRIIGTSNGNHRLGMADALGLRLIPTRVATRHEAWQRLREEVSRDPAAAGAHRDHPDLQDLIR